MKRWGFFCIFLSLAAQAAFEAIDCGQNESIFQNPTAILKPAIQTLHVQAFGILPYTILSYTHPTHIGCGISSFGNNLYRENEIMLGYGWIKNNIGFAVSIRGMFLSIKGYGSDYTLGLDFGTEVKINSSTSFNLIFQNLNLPSISGDEIPKRVAGGFILTPNHSFKIVASLYKESWHPFEVRISGECKLSSLLSLGLGIKTYPESFSFGILLNPNKVGLSYFVRTHPVLGLTHIVGIKYV